MATTKKTAPEAAKTETAKIEAVKAAEAVAETVTAVDTKAEEVAAPAKATAKKTTKKAATKKTTTKKAAKKEEAAEVAAPAATTEFFIEYEGGQISTEDIIRLVKGNYGKDVTDLKVYFKLDDYRAYYIADGVEGSVKVLF